jgi:hypothetical protein
MKLTTRLLTSTAPAAGGDDLQAATTFSSDQDGSGLALIRKDERAGLQ